MTLADALLINTLSVCMELILDKKTRDTITNLTRYITLILKMAPCVRVYGQVMFCKDVINPNFNLEKQKEKPKEKPKQEKGKE